MITVHFRTSLNVFTALWLEDAFKQLVFKQWLSNQRLQASKIVIYPSDCDVKKSHGLRRWGQKWPQRFFAFPSTLWSVLGLILFRNLSWLKNAYKKVAGNIYPSGRSNQVSNVFSNGQKLGLILKHWLYRILYFFLRT